MFILRHRVLLKVRGSAKPWVGSHDLNLLPQNLVRVLACVSTLKSLTPYS